MPTNKKLSLVVLSGVLALYISPAYAESLDKLEKAQMGNSTASDVDPGASKGTDKSIVKQERDQLGGSTGPNVDPGASKGPDASIVDQERQQIPH